MATVKVMLNMDRKSKSELYPLVIRVIHERRKKLIYSSYKMRVDNFDKATQMVVSSANGTLSSKEIREINSFIKTQRNQLERIIHWLACNTNNKFSVDDILLKHGNNVVERYLFRYIDREVATKNRIKSFGTANLYRTTRESIKRFTGNKDILFNEVNYKFIYDYINYLQERGLGKNTIHMYLRNFRLIYNKAKKEGIISAKISPFTDIKMNAIETVKRSLTKDSVRLIAHADFSANKKLEQARDIFMFSFYTRGMSLVDILYLKRSDIKNGIIYYTRNKTKQNLQVSITSPLQRLINKYKSSSIFVLPYLSNDTPEAMYRQYKSAVWRINKHLKLIGALLNIDIPLTTYVARHSWATIAKNEGAPIAAISEGLGHTTEKTTQIYLRAFDRSIIDDVNKKVVAL